MVERRIQVGFFFILFALALVLSFFIFRPYLNILILSGTFAIIFYPLYRRLHKKLGGNWPRLSSLTTILVILIIVLLPLTLLSIQLVIEGQDLFSRLQEDTLDIQVELPFAQTNQTIARWELNINEFLERETASLDEYVERGRTLLEENAGLIFKSIGGAFIAFFVWVLSLFYFFKDGHKIKKVAVSASPLKDSYDYEIIQRLITAVKSVVGGTLLVALLQGILLALGFLIVGIPTPFIWGAVAVITALIPNVGTALVSGPGVIYLLLTNNIVGAIILLVWSMFIVGTLDNILRPILIERGINIHPLLILLSVLGGLALFGPIGFITGPLIITLLSEFGRIYKKLILKEV
ncbi:MAG: AI-2E family transporter [Candidatus Harrisonbacteria bacterium]|nr:AI-2E family transporter [Candidatus Harrisonbacteria bacterium]